MSLLNPHFTGKMQVIIWPGRRTLTGSNTIKQNKHSVTEKLAHQKQMNGRPLHEALMAQESIPLRVVIDGGTAYADHLKKHKFKLACDSLSLDGLCALLMAVLCGTAGNETRLIMWKITLAQTMSCQAIRWPRRLSAQFKRLRDNWKQRWHFSDHDHATANWTAGFSSLYRTLCKVLACTQKGWRRQLKYLMTHRGRPSCCPPFPSLSLKYSLY